ncbi:CDP-diacylglycerol--glycerol-3-phosphate 3-phosphatidyltransferase [Syntrophobotulus glycolicus DSM 8271]|uniref:CDP-diacylglycerol--glycerol-3-phosphate 3-phosphatidyltransferase n=1 Tax=Syntrophobotulus glycolicus (strain DSM 8271 / FlGlyR) TaxID=645991 RepID=F0STX9_SYNGF|nr:CDP-diacylglycerol--glycerol-3-phosphate 3-phosphatidyltransferase [Syntrophobotulus glycolicus]ADY56502.1 CDP-diacylglycerol--glycerol-3-phosphate 3-phosphatidyltransferase [Syntrophobotulus glycolicus DSM 8271]
MLNLPNILTLVRIVMVPVFMVILLLKLPGGKTYFAYQNFVAAAIFIIAAATDGLDGFIARKLHQVTNLGKFLDPLADKLLVSAALISLVQMHKIYAWIVWVILAREFAVTGLRAIAAADGVVISASKLGKIKTVSQVIAISIMLLNDWPFSYLGIYPGKPLIYLALVLTIISGVDYIVKARKLLSKKDIGKVRKTIRASRIIRKKK